jgi:hypothetical protein
MSVRVKESLDLETHLFIRISSSMEEQNVQPSPNLSTLGILMARIALVVWDLPELVNGCGSMDLKK